MQSQSIGAGVCVFVALLGCGLAGINAKAQPSKSTGSRPTLKEYIAQLQENPGDQDLRKEIINRALTLRPKPAIPDEAHESAGQAAYFFNNSRGPEDFAKAVKAYEEALLAAPWVPDYYFNLGVAQEKAGNPDRAIGSLRLYLLASPRAQDREAVLERIGGLKAAAAQAAAHAGESSLAKQDQNKDESFIRELDGAGFHFWPDGRSGGFHVVIEIHGFEAVIKHHFRGRSRGEWGPWDESVQRAAIRGRKFNFGGSSAGAGDYAISDDGERITCSTNELVIFRRER